MKVLGFQFLPNLFDGIRPADFYITHFYFYCFHQILLTYFVLPCSRHCLGIVPRRVPSVPSVESNWVRLQSSHVAATTEKQLPLGTTLQSVVNGYSRYSTLLLRTRASSSSC